MCNKLKIIFIRTDFIMLIHVSFCIHDDLIYLVVDVRSNTYQSYVIQYNSEYPSARTRMLPMQRTERSNTHRVRLLSHHLRYSRIH